MANSGSARRSGNPKSGSGGSAKGGSGGNPSGAASGSRQSAPSAGAGGNGSQKSGNASQRTSKAPADERARERLAQQRAGGRKQLQGAPSRARSTKTGPNRRYQKRRSTAATAGIFGSILVVLAVVVIVLVSTLGGAGSGKVSYIPTQPIPANVLSGITNVSSAQLASAGTGGNQVIFAGAVGSGYPVVAPKGAAELKKDGKPLITYFGAEYCPFCAATRWGFAIALAKFGTFSNLQVTGSSPYDVYPNTHTLSFAGTTYSSNWLSLDTTEQLTNICTSLSGSTCSAYKPLETPSKSTEALITKYDNTTYFGQADASGAGIPFIDMGGRWVQSGAPFPSSSSNPPQTLAGLSWTQIVNTFTVPTAGPGQAILGAANHYIAAFCELTHGHSNGNYCSMPIIKSLQKNGLK